MERREFLVSTCSLCLAAGAGLLMGSFSSCSSLPVYETTSSQNRVTVPTSLFRESNLQIVRPSGSEFDIALRKIANGQYVALVLECTHANNPLAYTGKGFLCSVHGSRFDENGKVLHGPARLALKHLNTEVSADEITILIP